MITLCLYLNSLTQKLSSIYSHQLDSVVNVQSSSSRTLFKTYHLYCNDGIRSNSYWCKLHGWSTQVDGFIRLVNYQLRVWRVSSLNPLSSERLWGSSCFKRYTGRPTYLFHSERDESQDVAYKCGRYSWCFLGGATKVSRGKISL